MIRYLPYGEKIDFQTFSVLLFIFLLIWWIVLKWQGTYGYQRLISFKSFAVKAFQASILGMLVLFSIMYMVRWKEVPRTLILTLSAVAFLTLIIEKLFWLKFLEYQRKKGRGLNNVLIVGVGDIAQKLIDSINKYGDWGLRIVGFIVRDVKEYSTYRYAPILGNFQSISQILHENPIDEVIFALPLKDLEDVREVIEICEVEGVKTRFITHFFGGSILKAEADIIHGIPIITYSPTSRKVWELVAKRTIDILLSAIFLILVSPIFLIIALLIKVTSPGPVK